MFQGENMPDYFYTESMEAERLEEEDRKWEEWALEAAQLGLNIFPEDDDESSEDDEFPEDDDEMFPEDDR